jgi:hypothetical protein
MKKLILFALFAMILSNLVKSQDDISALESYIMSKIYVETESLYSPDLESVLAGKFFKAIPWLEETNGASSCGNYIMRIHEGEVFQISFPGSDEDMPWLLDMVKEDFRLSDENDAKLFESALDAIFPVSSFDEEKKEHLLIDGKWFFVRGDFFDSKTAVIVTNDSSGKITSISYKLEAIE